MDPEQPADVDLTCWYINQRRIVELLGHIDFLDLTSHGKGAHQGEHLRRLYELAAFKNATTDWIRKTKTPTLGQLVMSGQLRHGVHFTHFGSWHFKGSGALYDARSSGDQTRTALAYSKLDEFEPGLRIECRYGGDHMTSTTSWGEMSGQKPMLIFGLITNIDGQKIEAIPYVVANPIPRLTTVTSTIGRGWGRKLEVFVDGIDSFEKVGSVQAARSQQALEVLRSIPEAKIKAAFAEIIGEPNVPKDWGGERSDLVSDRVVIDGDRITTAFAFKGPAKFGEMTLAHLGKNGDQIDRLFSEPADLLILQHCHKIASPVRGAMRAYASNIGNPRLFCLIDGYDTLRVLRAYSKCGLSPPKPRRKQLK